MPCKEYVFPFMEDSDQDLDGCDVESDMEHDAEGPRYVPTVVTQDLHSGLGHYGLWGDLENEEGLYGRECQIDPESNFYNRPTSCTDNCGYFTDQQFNDFDFDGDGVLSIIHFNSRSLNRNFPRIVDYLNQFKRKFNVIAVSETWLHDDNANDFVMKGYEMFVVNRANKKGGGVALYVDVSLKCNKVLTMSKECDGLFEIVTVEIEMKRSKNIIIICAY